MWANLKELIKYKDLIRLLIGQINLLGI
jgi:hypothetical protein